MHPKATILSLPGDGGQIGGCVSHLNYERVHNTNAAHTMVRSRGVIDTCRTIENAALWDELSRKMRIWEIRLSDSSLQSLLRGTSPLF